MTGCLMQSQDLDFGLKDLFSQDEEVSLRFYLYKLCKFHLT